MPLRGYQAMEWMESNLDKKKVSTDPNFNPKPKNKSSYRLMSLTSINQVKNSWQWMPLTGYQDMEGTGSDPDQKIVLTDPISTQNLKTKDLKQLFWSPPRNTNLKELNETEENVIEEVDPEHKVHDSTSYRPTTRIKATPHSKTKQKESAESDIHTNPRRW